jgi:DNA (cytosine-5)-methyltransferase 1
MNELALFAGAGGGILGGHLLGWRTVCAVEWEPYPASVLMQRQNEGILPPFPIWDDVRTFDGRPWRGRVDVVSGGFPCQDISAAGKGAGIDGERSGMWAHMARIIREVGPRYAFVENSPMLTSRGLRRVLGDLAEMGYDARWGVLGAVDADAPHKRDRIWIVAYAQSGQSRKQTERERRENLGGGGCDHRRPEDARSKDLADPDVSQREGVRQSIRSETSHSQSLPPSAWWRCDPAEASESGVGRMADGMAARVDRLKAIGNGQVPAVAALAWRILSK